MIEVIDGLRDLFAAATPGISVDRSASEPIEFADGTLYAWEEASAIVNIGTGDEIRENFDIVLVYTRDNEGEVADVRRSRAVSEALDAKRKAWIDAVRSHKSSPGLWSSISASVDADMVRNLGLRGLGIHVSGYRLTPGED